jgi:hypothetical protein
MKVLFSLIVLFTLVGCGKKFEDRSQETSKDRANKSTLTADETWIILSERPLPPRVLVVINEMSFVNECLGEGNADIQRTPRNGSISIPTSSAFRQDYFNIDIYDCRDGAQFFSQKYVDTTLIVHPQGAPVRVILRLRNN